MYAAPVIPRRLPALFFVCVLAGQPAAVPTPGRVDRAAALKPGVLLYAAPGLPEPNFAKTVILLLDHGARGSMGLVLNVPSERSLTTLLDLEAGAFGADVPVYWGGPVEQKVVLALVRSRPMLGRGTSVKDVSIARDLEEVRSALADAGGRTRVRVFSGYAGWDPGQLATEVRGGYWVIDQADAATVFTSEPSRLWERVYEILKRVMA